MRWARAGAGSELATAFVLDGAAVFFVDSVGAGTSAGAETGTSRGPGVRRGFFGAALDSSSALGGCADFAIHSHVSGSSSRLCAKTSPSS